MQERRGAGRWAFMHACHDEASFGRGAASVVCVEVEAPIKSRAPSRYDTPNLDAAATSYHANIDTHKTVHART